MRIKQNCKVCNSLIFSHQFESYCDKTCETIESNFESMRIRRIKYKAEYEKQRMNDPIKRAERNERRRLKYHQTKYQQTDEYKTQMRRERVKKLKPQIKITWRDGKMFWE